MKATETEPCNGSQPVATETVSLNRRLVRLRWALPLIVLALAAFHQAILYALLDRIATAWHSLTQLAVYGVTGILVAWIGLTWIIRAVAGREKTEADLRRAYADLERTHRQLQAIHELGQRVTDAADVQELLDISARTPVELVNAIGSAVVTFEQNSSRVNLEMTWGLGETAETALRRQVEAGMPAEACAGCRPLTARIMDDCPLLNPLRAAGCAGEIRQVVCLPLARGDEKRLGVIAAYLGERPTPPPQQLHLLNILAAEITAALESVRLRARQMATLYAVDRATQDRQDLDRLLGRVLEMTMAGWGVQAGAILLVDETGTWNIRAHRGLGENLDAARFGLALRLAEEARAAGRTLMLPDGGDQAGGMGLFLPGGLASVVAALLQTEGETLGALFLGAADPGAFTSAQINLLSAVAHQIALATRNAQSYSRLRQMAVLEERYRLSREMHDGLAQTLGCLGMELERLERRLAAGAIGANRDSSLRAELAALRHDVAEAYLDVREAIDGLRLPIDQPGGVARALQELVDGFAERTGLQAECVCTDVPEDVPPEAALHLLRITQEALANVRRHAQARHPRVQLTRVDGLLELTVADDGRGFEPTLPGERRHHGLATMRERARSLGGQFSLATSPGQGTRVVVRLPL